MAPPKGSGSITATVFLSKSFVAVTVETPSWAVETATSYNCRWCFPPGMDSSDPADRVLRASAVIVLAATMFGLLVWYGTVAGGRSTVESLLDASLWSLIAGVTAPLSTVSVHSSFLASTAPGAVPEKAQTVDAHTLYVVSALAGAWVLIRCWRSWQLDVDSLTVVPRGTPDDEDA